MWKSNKKASGGDTFDCSYLYTDAPIVAQKDVTRDWRSSVAFGSSLKLNDALIFSLNPPS